MVTSISVSQDPVDSATRDSAGDVARHRIDEVRREVTRVFLGSPHVVDLLLVALLAQGHVLIEGVPGVAKTTLAKAFCDALGGSMGRIQFTPDLLPSDITGTYVLSPKDATFTLRRGPVFANVVLADEINRAPAKTQSALLESMQEQQVTIEGDRYDLPRPFLVLATQNPIDLEGTYPLPEAQIDRFLMRVSIGYPQFRHEVAMVKKHSSETPRASTVLSSQEAIELQALAGGVHVEDDLYEYAVGLVEHTRRNRRVLLGASPRATLGLIQAAKANAVLQGRSYVIPDDIQYLAPVVLAHRLVLTADVDGDEAVRMQCIRDAIHQVGYRKKISDA